MYKFKMFNLDIYALKVTTFDYIKITCDHPQVETMTPVGMAQKYFSGVRFDFMVNKT